MWACPCVEDLIWVVTVAKRVLAELDALGSVMDLSTRSIWDNRSSADPAGRRVVLGRGVVTLATSSLETRDVMKLGAVRSDVVLVVVRSP